MQQECERHLPRPTWRAAVGVAPWVLALLCLAGCASRPSGSTRSPAGLHDWSAVMRLDTGSAVRIDDTAGNSVAGRLVRVDGDEVAISAGSSPRRILRAEVQRLFVTKRLTARKAKVGWLAGTIAGGLVGALVTETNRLPWTLLMSAGWGGIGAAIGASDGFFDRQESLVYQAPPLSPFDDGE